MAHALQLQLQVVLPCFLSFTIFRIIDVTITIRKIVTRIVPKFSASHVTI